MSTLYILNAGHGNCAVLLASAGVAIIDGASPGHLVSFVSSRNIDSVRYVLLSHADSDHVSGIIPILNDPSVFVSEVFLNPDPLRTTSVWTDLKIALYNARSRGTVVHSALTSTDPGHLSVGEIDLEVLAPNSLGAIAGPGGTLASSSFSANSLSAAIRLVVAGKGLVFLPGDLDAKGLAHLLADYEDVRAETLVFPHHGGWPGTADIRPFVSNLLNAVRPSSIVFPNGRRYGNPRPEVVQAVLEADSQVYLACTSLSRNCCPDEALGADRTDSVPCAGPVSIDLANGAWLQPAREAHQEFIDLSVPTPMCHRA